MPIRTLQKLPLLAREKDLQELMEHWPERAAGGWLVAGAPAWLREARGLRRTQPLPTSFGWNFQPDVLFEDEKTAYVVELKRAQAEKVVPIALPEVLHHAWMLDHLLRERLRIGAKTVVPVITSPMNGWLRASLAFLHEHGLAPRSIRYLEFETLLDGDRKILWIGEPLADWEDRSEPPAHLASAFPFAHWYSVHDEAAWFGLGQELPQRPAFVSGRYLEAAQVERTVGDYVVCAGEYGGDLSYSLVSP